MILHTNRLEMARTYKKRPGARRYCSYSTDTLAAAVSAIESKRLTLSQASRQYSISKGTLSNKIKGLHPKKIGMPTAFTELEEMTLVNHIKVVGQWGYPFTTLDMRFVAKNYLDSIGRNVKRFRNNMPSSDWARSFLKRHATEICQRLCQNIKRVRAAVSADEVKKYFENLQISLTNEDGSMVEATNILNYDETNLTDDPGIKRCIFRRGVKYPERIQDSTKVSTSITFCGSASGQVLPPYVVYKSEHLWDLWTQGGPRRSRYNRSKSGWFDAVTFADWFSSVFVTVFTK